MHPREELGHAANFIYMMIGREPKPLEERALDTDHMLHAEHALDASTYSSRIAASTKSDIYAGIVSAMGTLMRPLHGGASQAVIEMLREVKEGDETPREYIRRKLDEDELIPGFCHMVYKATDPRAKELKKLARELDQIGGTTGVYWRRRASAPTWTSTRPRSTRTWVSPTIVSSPSSPLGRGRGGLPT